MRENSKKAAVHNLGCKVNSYELDIIVQKLEAAGYTIVPFDEKADLYVVNTCTVTNIADRKSRQMLHRAKALNPDAVVAAVGCYVETDAEKIRKDPAIDIALGNKDKTKLPEMAEKLMRERERADAGMPDEGAADAPDKTAAGAADEGAAGAAEGMTEAPLFLTQPGHTRAYIKIQDGCNQFCSYCIIPYARGRITSRDTEEILQEITGLAARGIREVVLTGIHVSSFGKDRGEDPQDALLELLTRIQLLSGIRRIRLSSLEPRIMTERFVTGIARLSKVCPHFHLSLQSGCDETLKRMNRHYTTEEYAESVARLRRCFDRPAITTDVIVGFPGETQEEFERSKAFLEEIGFYEIHVFRYSARKGTVAAGMPGQLTNAVKEERSSVLLSLTERQAQDYRALFDGREEEVLLEEEVLKEGKRYFRGHTMRYVEVYVPADALPQDTDPSGQIVRGILHRREEADGTPYYVMMPQA